MKRLHSLRLPKSTKDKTLDGLLVVSLLGLLADTITFVLLPVGSEANPIVNMIGVEGSIMVKSAIGLYLFFLWSYLPLSETHLMVYAIAIAGGFLGFGSNLSVLLAS